MKYRKLGDSDLEVSEISLGSWLTYGVGVEADKARACLTLIDHAVVHGPNALSAAQRLRLLGDASALATLRSRVLHSASHPEWRQPAFAGVRRVERRKSVRPLQPSTAS